MVTSDAFSEAIELDARRKAIADWMKRSKDAGVAHPLWRIAYQRALVCSDEVDGFTCIASAAPCVIRQKPPDLKPGRPSETHDTDIIAPVHPG